MAKYFWLHRLDIFVIITYITTLVKTLGLIKNRIDRPCLLQSKRLVNPVKVRASQDLIRLNRLQFLFSLISLAVWHDWQPALLMLLGFLFNLYCGDIY
jgi:hypothetical protein